MPCERQKVIMSILTVYSCKDLNRTMLDHFDDISLKVKKQDTMGIAPLKKGVYLNSNSLAKAEILNEQFKSVFRKEDNRSGPHLQGEPYPTIPSPNQKEGVEKQLQQLNGNNMNKSSGPDLAYPTESSRSQPLG